MLLDEGELFHDTYEVDRFLGEGAFAEVYRVQHRFLGRQAMRVFKSPGTSREGIEQKLSEAIILSKIGHPNVIRVFDAGIVETRVGPCGYFTMEYVAGGSLERFWRSFGPNFVPVTVAVEIARQVCAGLAVAHAEQPPIIHRDVKPQNILVGYDSGGLRIRVADFGLAKQVNPLSLLASARGTPAFKPPECLSNADSCAADVWGIGATLYLVLTDHLPFPIGSRMELADERPWRRPLVPASRFNPQVDALLDSIVRRSLQKKPADRYPDAAAMLKALLHWEPSCSDAASGGNVSADEDKSALGSLVRTNQVAAERMAAQALSLSRDANRLCEAADLLEEALNMSQELRQKYQYQIRLWRRGIVI